MNEKIRLQKYLAQCGVASRRKAEELIQAGRIRVDGQVITEPGSSVDPDHQRVEVDGWPVRLEEKKVYFLLNKPKGYVTTLSDPQGRPIVTDLIPGRHERLFPVGRLDLDTEGALILTNDGDLAQRIQHPSNEVTKTYEALVKGIPSETTLTRLARGITIEGRLTAPARLHIARHLKNSCLVVITIHEGRKRQVRKMFQAVAHPVINLKRIAYGALRLENLAEGGYRPLTPKDLKKIFENIPLQTKK